MHKVIISALAEQDLTDIWTYIARDNVAAADALLRSIDKTCETLLLQPQIGRTRDELFPGVFCFPVKQYLIFYRLGVSGIEIIRILHGSRDISKIF